MIDGASNPLSPLLLHNAIAVVLAALLAQVFRSRSFSAFTAAVLAVLCTFTWTNINFVYEFAWWRFVYLPMWYAGTALSNGAFWPRPTFVEVFAALVLYLSPLVFAYFTAWQWNPGTRASGGEISHSQFRLHTAFVAITLFCFLLCWGDWVDQGRVIAYPIVMIAALLAVRPVHWWKQQAARRRHDRRLALLLASIRSRGPQMESISQPPVVRWQPSDLCLLGRPRWTISNNPAPPPRPRRMTRS